MLTYTERYLAGEYEAVWRELQALDSAVREEPVYSDAVGVAHETMRRVRTNLATIVERLHHLGFRFGKYGKWHGTTLLRESDLVDSAGPWPAPITPPRSNFAEFIRAVEEQHGVLPISLRAFYEIVGAVNLWGYFYIAPGDWARHALDAMPQSSNVVPETLDPLQVFPFGPEVVNDPNCPDAEEYEKQGDFVTLFITVDPTYDIGSFETIIPCETMDGCLWIEVPSYLEERLLVNMLRRSFRYGGFNQLSPEESSDSGREAAAFLRALRTPEGISYLDYLTRDLLPF